MENNIVTEKIRQNKISNAKKQYTEVDVKSKYILKCNFEGYRSKTYSTVNVSCEDIKFWLKAINKNLSDEVYVLILVIELVGIEYMIGFEISSDKNNLLEYKKLLDNKLKILFNDNKLVNYKIMKNTTIMGRDTDIDEGYSNLLIFSEEKIKRLSMRQIDDKGQNDNENNVGQNEITYKSIITDVKLNDDELILSYNNCKWTFQKDEYGLFCDNARKILENREGSEYAITIKDKGDESSNLKSENKDWWIKEDSII